MAGRECCIYACLVFFACCRVGRDVCIAAEIALSLLVHHERPCWLCNQSRIFRKKDVVYLRPVWLLTPNQAKKANCGVVLLGQMASCWVLERKTVVETTRTLDLSCSGAETTGIRGERSRTVSALYRLLCPYLRSPSSPETFSPSSSPPATSFASIPSTAVADGLDTLRVRGVCPRHATQHPSSHNNSTNPPPSLPIRPIVTPRTCRRAIPSQPPARCPCRFLLPTG
jgi:hypothetical protein